MENKKKLCPIAKDDCIEDLCGWYSEPTGICSVKLIAQAMCNQADFIRGIGKSYDKNQKACPHGYMDWDDCPDCRH